LHFRQALQRPEKCREPRRFDTTPWGTQAAGVLEDDDAVPGEVYD
jgi:hypothetical protein